MDNRTDSWKINPPAPDYFRALSWEQFTSELGRQLALARRQVESACEVCGKPISGTAKRRYCSNTCAVRAYRARHRQDQSDQAD